MKRFRTKPLPLLRRAMLCPVHFAKWHYHPLEQMMKRKITVTVPFVWKNFLIWTVLLWVRSRTVNTPFINRALRIVWIGSPNAPFVESQLENHRVVHLLVPCPFNWWREIIQAMRPLRQTIFPWRTTFHPGYNIPSTRIQIVHTRARFAQPILPIRTKVEGYYRVCGMPLLMGWSFELVHHWRLGKRTLSRGHPFITKHPYMVVLTVFRMPTTFQTAMNRWMLYMCQMLIHVVCSKCNYTFPK
jgi:hypothetical protein